MFSSEVELLMGLIKDGLISKGILTFVPCSEKNVLPQHQSLHIFTTCAHADQPLDLSLKKSNSIAPEMGNFKTFTC